jgi:basic membrane protein A
VVSGDRNDHGFYQGQVDAIIKAGHQLGYSVTIVDHVNPGASQAAFTNLCRQGVKLVVGGGDELTDGFAAAAQDPQCSSSNFVLDSATKPINKNYATIAADDDQAYYMGGVAAGLILQKTGGNTMCMVAGPPLPFVKAAAANLQAGMNSVATGKKLVVTYTGDFEDAALAAEALRAQIANGCNLFYAYLGGALPAANNLATQNGVPVMGTTVDLCGVPASQISNWNVVESILYNPSLYLGSFLKSYAAGKVKIGKQFALYGVGDSKLLGVAPNNSVGAKICSPTPQQQAKLDQVRQGIVNGSIKVKRRSS